MQNYRIKNRLIVLVVEGVLDDEPSKSTAQMFGVNIMDV